MCLSAYVTSPSKKWDEIESATAGLLRYIIQEIARVRCVLICAFNQLTTKRNSFLRVYQIRERGRTVALHTRSWPASLSRSTSPRSEVSWHKIGLLGGPLRSSSCLLLSIIRRKVAGRAALTMREKSGESHLHLNSALFAPRLGRNKTSRASKWLTLTAALTSATIEISSIKNLAESAVLAKQIITKALAHALFRERTHTIRARKWRQH